MKIALLSQYFTPERAGITKDVVSGLTMQGHEVRVLTGFPNYPQGKLYPGYKQKWRQIEKHGNVKVMRVPLFIDHSQSGFKRMLNYLSFAFTSSTARRFVKGSDVIYVYATQMTPAFGPWLWRMTGGAPYVLHVQDLWPDSITGSSLVSKGRLTTLIESLLNPWIRHVYKRSSAVIGIAPTMVRNLVERGANPKRTVMVYNWVQSSVTKELPTLEKPHQKKTGVHVVYAGNVGDLQDLETAIKAAVKARESGIKLTIIGDGIAKPKLERLVLTLGANNIEIKESVAQSDMGDVYAQADFGLVTLRDLPLFRGTIPSKLQSLLGSGLPIITTVQGDVRNLTEEYRFGLTSDAESVEDLARAFQEAAETDALQRQNMAERAKEAAESLFSLDGAIEKIENILKQAILEEKS